MMEIQVKFTQQEIDMLQLGYCYALFKDVYQNEYSLEELDRMFLKLATIKKLLKEG